jgi:transcription-repair coupling factor (superfamily II helicase)
MPTRLQIYRRIADIRNEEDALDVTDELIDRFGDPPSTVSGLIRISLIRAKAVKVDIYEISIEGNRLVFKLSDCNMDTMFKLRHKNGERFTLHNKNDKIYFSVTVTSKDDKLQLIDEIIDTAVKEEK